MSTFVLEIGTEELPARFLSNVEKELADRFTAGLEEAGYTFSLLDTCATPRRSVVIVEGLEDTQPVKEELVMGPPARIAFDAGGNPTKAAQGFAKTLGIDVSALGRTQTEKGEYLSGMKKTGGVPTLDVLACARRLSLLCPLPSVCGGETGSLLLPVPSVGFLRCLATLSFRLKSVKWLPGGLRRGTACLVPVPSRSRPRAITFPPS